jgi:hypothetical protein
MLLVRMQELQFNFDEHFASLDLFGIDELEQLISHLRQQRTHDYHRV